MAKKTPRKKRTHVQRRPDTTQDLPARTSDHRPPRGSAVHRRNPGDPEILIASPVAENPVILKHHLRCLSMLRLPKGASCVYYFIDNAADPACSALLKEFADTTVHPSFIDKREPLGNHRFEDTHAWDHLRLERMVSMRNQILAALKGSLPGYRGGFDYLFTADTDLLMRPDTLNKLLAHGVDIVSGVFWTQWNPGEAYLPNVWQAGVYEIPDRFIANLRSRPGLYQVGGLGACTLIKRSAADKGLSYDPIYNLGMGWWGEDRYFCVRAVALGFKLWADNTVEIYHVYRDSELTERLSQAHWLSD